MTGGIAEDFKNAFNRPNNTHIQLIIINVAVFVLVGIVQLITDLTFGRGSVSVMMDYLGMPMQFGTLLYRPWTPITYMFGHAGFFHIFFNMLFLYWFGRILSEYLGGPKVLNVYILGGLTGALLYMTVYPTILSLLEPGLNISTIDPRLIGASAGVFAVVFSAATLLPNYTVFLLFIGPVKIKYIALFYGVVFLISLAGQNSGGQVAHIGGALMGVLYIRQIQRGRDLGVWIQSFLRFAGNLFKPRPRIKVTYNKKKEKAYSATRSASGRAPERSGSASQEEIDAILDKISERGYESLSKEEKQKLFNASKR